MRQRESSVEGEADKERDPGFIPLLSPPVESAQAAVFSGPGIPLRDERRPIPAPGPHEVLVSISVATVCGSDLHTLEGRRHGPTPAVLGHEAVGRVRAVGPGRDPAWLGRRVSWSLVDACGACRPCTEWGLPQKCEHLFKYGHAALSDGSGLNGCYASHVLLRAGTHLVALPDSLTDTVCAPANCALATMVAVTESLPEPGRRVVVQGAGLLGLYACTLLKAAGWPEVVIVDRQPVRLLAVPRFGGIPLLNSGATGLDGGCADAVIEVSGNASVIAEGLHWLRPGGHYAIAGLVHPDSALRLTGETLIRKCLTLRGTHNYAPRHLNAAIDFLERNRDTHPWETLVSPPLPLSRLDEAFRLAASGRWHRVSVAPDRDETHVA